MEEIKIKRKVKGEIIKIKIKTTRKVKKTQRKVKTEKRIRKEKGF